MTQSVLNNKRILAVDDEPDVLEVLKEEIVSAAPKCHFETAGTYEQAIELLSSWTYDLLILDIMGVRGLERYRGPLSYPDGHAHRPRVLP